MQIPISFSKENEFKFNKGKSGSAGTHTAVNVIKKESTNQILSDGRYRMVGTSYWNQGIVLGEWCGFEFNEFDPPVNGGLIKLQGN
ncbi:MAG: hypothetical protein IPP06_12665 [Saprospiraceae bacterium]|nr:hypothetical protein [Candidatus Vicinibacter affinis]